MGGGVVNVRNVDTLNRDQVADELHSVCALLVDFDRCDGPTARALAEAARERLLVLASRTTPPRRRILEVYDGGDGRAGFHIGRTVVAHESWPAVVAGIAGAIAHATMPEVDTTKAGTMLLFAALHELGTPEMAHSFAQAQEEEVPRG